MICLLSTYDTRGGSNAQPTLPFIGQFNASLEIWKAFNAATLTSSLTRRIVAVLQIFLTLLVFLFDKLSGDDAKQLFNTLAV